MLSALGGQVYRNAHFHLPRDDGKEMARIVQQPKWYSSNPSALFPVPSSDGMQAQIFCLHPGDARIIATTKADVGGGEEWIVLVSEVVRVREGQDPRFISLGLAT